MSFEFMRLSFLKMSATILNNFELVLQSKYLGKLPIEVYRSKRTGLHVALTRTSGPVVNCHLVLSTKIKTNDGLPHTLEHLVFMGSKSYPFKGALDLLSMKLFAVAGTNAWTQQDHTAYFVKTIGESSMQNFIPVYGDHLINPLLTSENYQSEVYHVTDEGEEAGVVYSEIQDKEHELENLVDLKVKELVFPNLPEFYVDSGGRMTEVRELCSLERVRNYHKEFYHLRNMWIIISGDIEVEPMLKSIDILDSNPENKPPDHFERPFVNIDVPDITRHRSEPVTVWGPTEEGDEGIVEIGFISRPPWDLEFMVALEVLISYLTSNTGAPLKKGLVLCTDPYCDLVQISTIELPRCQISVNFSGVPPDKLDLLVDKFFEILRSSSVPDKLDLQRINYIIERKIKKLHSTLEHDIASLIVNQVIGFQLFTPNLNDQQQFERTMNPVATLNSLIQKPAEYWCDMINEIFTDNCAVVIGKPDSKLGNEIAEQEEKRLQKLKESLESTKRQKLDDKRKIEDASSCKFLSLFNIHFDSNIKVVDVNSNYLPPFVPEAFLNGQPKLLSNLPFTTVVHDTDTKFLRVYFLFDMRSIPLRLRKYLLLFDSLLSKSKAVVDGQLLTATEVANLMTKELMKTSFGPGFFSSYKHFYHFNVEMPINEFHLVPRWTKIFLNDTIFEKDTILTVFKNLANGAAASKRDESNVTSAVLRSLTTVKEHESRFYDDIVLEPFNRRMAKLLEGKNNDATAKKVIDELNELRQAILTAPVNMHVICNAKELDAVNPIPSDAWNFLNSSKNDKLPADKITFDFIKDAQAFRNQRRAGRILKMDSSDASFLMGMRDIDVEFGSPEHVAIIILNQAFSMVEGLLWCAVRGLGYAYDARIEFLPNFRALHWDLYRCSRPKLAYQATKEAIEKVFDTGKLDSVLFDLAKRATVSTMMSRYETLAGTAQLAALDYLHDRSALMLREVIDKVWASELEETIKIATPLYKNLFDFEHINFAAVCPRSKMDEIREVYPGIETITISDLQYTPA